MFPLLLCLQLNVVILYGLYGFHNTCTYKIRVYQLSYIPRSEFLTMDRSLSGYRISIVMPTTGKSGSKYIYYSTWFQHVSTQLCYVLSLL